MFGNQKHGKPVYPKSAQFNKEEKRQIDLAYQKAYQKVHPSGKSAQETLKFEQVFKDGICKVEHGFYSKTIQFEDINYQIAQTETQNAVIVNWMEFLHYFDENISFQLTFLSMGADHQAFEKTMRIPDQHDGLDHLRREFGERVLMEALEKGNNGLHKTKYITFGIHADNLASAKMRLNRIELDVQSLLKKMGCKNHALDGIARLHLMRDILHMNGSQPFPFKWDMVAKTGLLPKDFIVPSSFTFKQKQTFQTGNVHCQASYFNLEASDLSDRILVDLLDTETPQVVTIHIQPVEKRLAMKWIKSSLTSLSATKINHQKAAVQRGFDMDILPPDLVSNEKGVGIQHEQVQEGERLFLFSTTIINTGKTRKALQSTVEQVAGVTHTYNCHLEPLDYEQERGFMTALPLAKNLILRDRTILTMALTAFIPFTTQELFQTSANAIYCGLNALSNNIIMADRQMLANGNGLILGGSGTGKSFTGKMWMIQERLNGGDDVIVCDPESEYHEITCNLQGQVIIVSPASPHHINPMDLNENYGDDDQALQLKASFIFSMCELIASRSEGLSGAERSGIDKCLAPIYAKYFDNPIPENMPTLVEFLDEMKRQDNPNTASIRASMELYVTGTQNVFSHRTNVDINNRLVCYDIKGCNGNIKKLAMMIVQEQVWNRVTTNRAKKKVTRYYVDEFHLLLREPETAAHFIDIWKRFRKWGGVPTGITQNVGDLLRTRECQDIFSNSQFISLMSQQGEERDILARLLNISSDQLSYISTGNVGEGLLYYGGVLIPFINKFPQDTELYRMMTTKLSETNDGEPEQTER